MTKYRTRTQAIHAGEFIGTDSQASVPDIAMANSFVLSEASGFSIDAYEENKPFVYSRWDNPTVRMLEEKLAALENAEACSCFASGMAATSAVLNTTLSRGDHLVAIDVHYGGTAELIRMLHDSTGVNTTLVHPSDLEMIEASIQPGRTKLLWFETPSNPLLTITDIRAVAKLAHQVGAQLVIDSTLATPIATRPLDLGADYVVHSLSKYIGGHGDALGGAVLCNQANMKRIRDQERVHTGGVLSPFNAWLIARGVTTLPLRMAAHATSGLAVANFLESHPRVTRVLFPGLQSHPGHGLASEQMQQHWGGLLSFSVTDGKTLAQKLPEQVEIIHYAVSLGSHHSLIFWMDTDEMLRSSFKLPPALAEQYRTTANDGIFRLAVGLEDPEDLCNELARCLDHL